MADEKIVVVCDGNCNKCKIGEIFYNLDYVNCKSIKFGQCASFINGSIGDVVTIEIKRNKDLTK